MIDLEMLSEFLREREEADPERFLRVVSIEEVEEEDAPAPREAEIVEEGPFTRSVDSIDTTKFRYFCDGTQVSRLLAYDRGAPVVFGLTGAAVMMRDEKGRMDEWRHVIDGRIYLPTERIDEDPYEAAGIPLEDTSGRAKKKTPAGYRSAAIRGVQRYRRRAAPAKPAVGNPGRRLHQRGRPGDAIAGAARSRRQ